MGRPRKNISDDEAESTENMALVESGNVKSITPPAPLSFNARGLRNGINYIYDELGFVDWKLMIEPQYVVPNRFNFEERREAIPSSAEGLDDKDKLVLLWGFKRLAQIRGIRSVKFNPLTVTNDFVSLECEICWKGNFETDFQDFCFPGTADAHHGNTFSFAKEYLTAIAENRSFIRAVRNSLNIPILGKDEIGPNGKKFDAPSTVSSASDSSSEERGLSPTSPYFLLIKNLKDKGKTFEQLKEKLVKDGNTAAATWTKVTDIPLELALDVLGKYF